MLNKSITERDWERTPPEAGGGIATYVEVFISFIAL
jgi:hypothetical protein